MVTLKRSKYTNAFAAQCDTCHDIMDFEDDQDFPACVFVLRASGWRSKKDDEGRWTHKCSDCVKEEKNDA